MTIKHYPADRSYSALFEEVRQFILRLNENHTYDIYHWSRWEWYFARHSFRTEDLQKMLLFYEDQKLQGVLMLEDEPNIYYYLATSKAVKAQIVRELNHMPDATLMIEESDLDMRALIALSNWEETDYIEHMAKLTKDHIPYQLPEGYELLCIRDDYDVKKHHACLWKGFDHGGDIPMSDEHLMYRERQVSSPHFKKRYAYAATYQDEYVAWTSIWYQEGTDIAMIEPVCTVPEHRRKGLASATISKCVDAAIRDGAKQIIVGSNKKLYLSLGFEVYKYARVYKQAGK